MSSDFDAPAWLSEAPVPAPSVGSPPPVTNKTSLMEDTSADPAESSPNKKDVSDEELTAEVSKMVLIMRVMNLVVSFCMVVVSVFHYKLSSPSLFILSIYSTTGGVLIFLQETQLKFIRTAIALNFGFLFNFVWRSLFYFLLGTIVWMFGSLWDQIVSIAIFCTAIFNAYILCAYPSYRAMRDKIAEEEDKRIEAKISSEVKKQSMKAAVAQLSK